VNVIPLAAESLGVRSMATYVEVAGTGLLLDPGATLAPSRFGLPPCDAEWDAFKRANDRISAYAARAQFVFVSHYHDDHFRSDPATYAGHRVLAKDPLRMVSGLQAKRAAALWETLDGPAKIQSADGLVHREPPLELRVSPPLAHGVEGSALGYVVALTIADVMERERFVFASDVQGPLSAVATAYLLQERPTLLYLSGPPSYMEHATGAAVIDRGIDNLLSIIERTGCRVIMDHHALRDTRAAERFARLWDTKRVVTAAGYLGVPEAALESRRAYLSAGTRKPPAKAPSSRAIMTRTPPKSAKGGHRE
jgi:predicted metallo-beta-lactamase superfamily hydrolase